MKYQSSPFFEILWITKMNRIFHDFNNNILHLFRKPLARKVARITDYSADKVTT